MGGNMQGPPGMMQPNAYAMMNHQRQGVGMPPMQGGVGQPETFQMTQPGMPSAVTQQPSSAANAVPNPAAQANQIGNQQPIPTTGTPASGTPNAQANQIPPQQQQQSATAQPSQQVANQIAQGLKNSSFSPDMLQVSLNIFYL